MLNDYIYNKLIVTRLRKCRYGIGLLLKIFIFDIYLLDMLILNAEKSL